MSGSTSADVAAVVLAAGASSRFGSPKQALLLEPVLERVRRSSVGEIVVVLGAHEVETTARVVRCPEWERGPGASLRCGLAALDAAAAIVVLADGPELAPEAVDRVIAAWPRRRRPDLRGELRRRARPPRVPGTAGLAPGAGPRGAVAPGRARPVRRPRLSRRRRFCR